MLTIDDYNSIIQKYGQGKLLHEIDLTELPTTAGESIQTDYGIKITYNGRSDFLYDYEISNIPLFNGVAYCTKRGEYVPEGEIMIDDGYIINISPEKIIIRATLFPITQIIDKLHIVFHKPLEIPFDSDIHNQLIVVPISDTLRNVLNGEFDDHFYIKHIKGDDVNYYIDTTQVQLETDDNGTFIRLHSAKDCIIGGTAHWSSRIPLFKITFKEFKTLPIPYIPTLYKGTPQSIQVLNTEDDDPITDYQTYYQGRLLKDNTIQLPYDSDDYVDIMVDLKDYRYPFCTLKLKAPTTLYTANSQSDVETAIENGIQTLQVGDTQTEVTLNEIALTNVTLINSNIQLTDSTVTDCQIIDTSYTDNGGNNITNTIFNSVDYTNTAQSNYNQVTFTECNIHDSEINLTGTISKSTITDTLILSDGVINIQDNTFTGVGVKEYFPSHLYLTGDYTVTGNTFNLTGEWTELEYNMCIIKATNDFNPSNFIKQNNLQLNITYDSEPVNTFYYNLVDEDKIRAVRL